VRRLVLYEEPGKLVRDISLKPGLNIIWSPDMSSSGRNALAHGSGKTLFCRLLRACLGEPGYATNDQRQRIMASFPKGFAAAEIIIDEQCWVAVRSFGLKNDYVVQASNVEEALTRGRQKDDPKTIDQIVNKTFFASLFGRVPPEIGDDGIWDVFRAWLTRDQECRLGDVLAWRSVKTNSGSRAQRISETAKLTMVRLALGALDKKEQAAAAREKELLQAKEKEQRRQSYLVQRKNEMLRELRQFLEVGEDVGIENSLGQKGLVFLAEERFRQVMRAQKAKFVDTEALHEEYAELHRQRADLKEKKKDNENKVENMRGEARRLRSEAELGELDNVTGEIRLCPVCRVPIDDVLQEGCKMSSKKCDMAKIRANIQEKWRRANSLEEEAKQIEMQVKTAEEQLSQIDKDLKKIEKNVKEANAANKKAIMEQGLIYQARRMLDEARLLQKMEAQESKTPGISEELATVRAQLEQGRKRACRAMASLQERFQGILHAWLPEGATGDIKLDGNGLQVSIHFSERSEISTAALDSLKILAFDLAVLHLATEEKISLPPFLLHDSPREADLDAALYARLFELIYEWGEGEVPKFQYIITTTTAPPKNMQSSDHVRLCIYSSPPEKRLFKRDI